MKTSLEKNQIIGMPTLTLRDKDGNLKPLWNDNWIGKKVLAFIRKYTEYGTYLHLYGLRIPYLLGSWKNDLAIHNLIPSTGKAGGASRWNGSGSEAAFTYLAVGIGTTAAAAGNTTLESEITDTGLARAAATCTRVTTSVTNDTAKLAYTWTATGAKAVTELGAFNASSAGILGGRQVFAAINTASGDSFGMDYRFQF